MSQARARAKTLILAWVDSGNPTKSFRARFSADIDRFFDEVQSRNGWSECLSTLLDDQGAVDFAMAGRGWRARPCEKGIVVTSILPSWSFGWNGVLKDDLAQDTLSWLGHYCRQYIHRSNIAKVLMSVWERTGQVLHPFGTGLSIQRYSDIWPAPTETEIFLIAERNFAGDWGKTRIDLESYRSKWTLRNTLDPSIHQAIYHFLRARNLSSSDFELEALVAHDCVIQSLQNADWSWAPGDPRRDRRDLIGALGFGKQSAELAEHVYFLRNQFSVHAGGWRWWDADEYLEDDLCSRVAKLTWRSIRRAADLEPAHRRLQPDPTDWGNWLEDNFPLIWSAVWHRTAT